MLEESSALDEEEDRLYGAHKRGDKLPPELADRDSQAYSAQVAVDSDHQVIVEAEVIQTGSDGGQLLPIVARVVDNLELTPKAVSADAGYWKASDVATLEWYDIDPVVAPRRYRHSEWRNIEVCDEPIPGELPARERMDRKLRTPRGRQEYDKHKVTAEPVFGQIKRGMGFE